MSNEIILADEAPAMKYTPMVSLTKKDKVKLKLQGTAFPEMCAVMGTYSERLGELVGRQLTLTAATAAKRAQLSLVIDLWEYQVSGYVLRSTPDVVTVTLSRCEAHVLWQLVNSDQPPRDVYPAFSQLVDDLHKLIC